VAGDVAEGFGAGEGLGGPVEELGDDVVDGEGGGEQAEGAVGGLEGFGAGGWGVEGAGELAVADFEEEAFAFAVGGEEELVEVLGVAVGGDAAFDLDLEDFGFGGSGGGVGHAEAGVDAAAGTGGFDASEELLGGVVLGGGCEGGGEDEEGGQAGEHAWGEDEDEEMGLDLADGEAGVDAGAVEGGVEAAGDADGDGEAEGEGEEFDGDLGFDAALHPGHEGKDFQEGDAGDDADDTGGEAEGHRLEEDHAEDAAAFPAEGEEDADFAGAFEDAHEHGVHDAEGADEEGDDGGAPVHGFEGFHAVALGEDFFGDVDAAAGDVLLDDLGDGVGVAGFGVEADVDEVDHFVFLHDALQKGEADHDGAVFDHCSAIGDADDFEFVDFDGDFIAGFFLEHFGGEGAEDDDFFIGAGGEATGDDFEVFPQEALPLAAGDDHHGNAFDAEDFGEEAGDVADAGDLGDLFGGGVGEGLGDEAAAGATDDEVGFADFVGVGPTGFETPGEAEEGHDGADAEADAHDGEGGADAAAAEVFEGELEEGHGGVERRTLNAEL
jgi:hypothetical protein